MIPGEYIISEGDFLKVISMPTLAAGQKSYWGEIITCDRKTYGKIFKFTYLRNILEVYRDGRLIFKEQLLLLPKTSCLAAIGQLEYYSHQATLIFLHGTAANSFLTDLVYNYVNGEPGVAAGVSQTAHQGLVVRILGNSGEQLFQCLQKISLILQESTAKAIKPITI